MSGCCYPPCFQVRSSIQRIGRLCGAEVEQDDAYPGWAPNPDASIVKITAETIGRIAGEAAGPHSPGAVAVVIGCCCGAGGKAELRQLSLRGKADPPAACPACCASHLAPS